jgi:hypothetical protein
LFRRSIRHLFLTAALATSLAVAAPIAGAAPATDVRGDADRIMNLTAAQFAKHEQVAPFDWSTDGCTGSTPGYGELFRQPCTQHDFGYRNYGGQGELKLSPTEETRDWIDQRFLEEMKRVCGQQSAEEQETCVANANVMYGAVALFGGIFF